MNGKEPNGLSDEEFTAAERKRLRGLLRDDDRSRWFWALVKTWLIWLSSVAAGVVVAKDIFSLIAQWVR